MLIALDASFENWTDSSLEPNHKKSIVTKLEKTVKNQLCLKNAEIDLQADGSKSYELFALILLQKQSDKFVKDLFSQYGSLRSPAS